MADPPPVTAAGPNWATRIIAICMAVLTLLIVAGVAVGGYFLLQQGPRPGPQAGADRRMPPSELEVRRAERKRERAAPAPAPQPTPAPRGPRLLRDGDVYYAHVKLIELRPKKPGGDAWDMFGGAPDITYKIYWNGTELRQGDHRNDALIAEWDLLKLDLLDAVTAGNVEVATAVNAPLVRATGGGTLTVRVWDDDDATLSDEAGRFDLPMKTLREGVNTIEPDDDKRRRRPAGPRHGPARGDAAGTPRPRPAALADF